MKNSKLLTFIIFNILTTNLLANDYCIKAAKDLISSYNGEVTLADIESTLNFDCKESSLIKNEQEPFSDSVNGFDLFIDIVDKFPFKFLHHSIDILEPYCRENNSWFGTFCMAADTSSAFFISKREDLMDKLPLAILMISKKIDENKKFDILPTLRSLFGDDKQSIRDWVLFSSFIGLDNNGVQTSRVLANLLFSNDIKNYSKLFPVFFQMGDLPPREDGIDYTGHFAKVLFSTRIGNATIDGLDPEQTKTFKAYAGVYFGCQMAIEGFKKRATATEGYLMGYSYEIIKVAKYLGLGIKEVFQSLKFHHRKGKNTGFMMKKGTLLGYELCR